MNILKQNIFLRNYTKHVIELFVEEYVHDPNDHIGVIMMMMIKKTGKMMVLHSCWLLAHVKRIVS